MHHDSDGCLLSEKDDIIEQKIDVIAQHKKRIAMLEEHLRLSNSNALVLALSKLHQSKATCSMKWKYWLSLSKQPYLKPISQKAKRAVNLYPTNYPAIRCLLI